MDTISFMLANILRDSSSVIMALLVFLATGTTAFAAMAFIRVRGAVKRRTSRMVSPGERAVRPSRSLRYSSLKAASQLIEYTTKHYSGTDDGNLKILRRRLVQAGIYDTRGVAYFFMARTALAVGLAFAVFLMVPMLAPQSNSFFWLMVIVGGIAGYVGPSMYIDRRIAARKVEHRSGFPDFMDLLVVCADSGLSMEASFERIGRELGDSYPSLTANIHMTNLEIRAVTVAALFQPEGRGPTDRIHHQALLRDRRRQPEDIAPAAGPGRHLRYPRRRLLLHGAHRAGGRPRLRRLPDGADAGAAEQFVLLADGDRRRHSRLRRPQHVYRPAHRRPQSRAPLWLSGFHGPAGGVRRFRPVDGGGADAGRTRTRRQLSVAVRQHPHRQSRDPRRPAAQRCARAFRRPAGAGRGAFVRHLDQPVDRSGLQHHRCVAGLQRRHAPQAALARRGKGLRVAGEAFVADDDLHFPGDLRRHPAAGVRAPALRKL